jgi:hypothetical protein
LTTPRCSIRWGRRARIQADVPPSGLAPLQSMTRVAAHRRARSHEVSGPQTQPSRRDPPLPGFHLPGSRCALTLTMRLGALLPQQPPWCLSTRCAHGIIPSELDLTAVAAHLSAPAVPLAIGHAGPLSTLSRSPVLRASSKRASLQGLSHCRLGPARSDFSSPRRSWLSWVSPPWGSPLPCSDLHGRTLSIVGFRATPPPAG